MVVSRIVLDTNIYSKIMVGDSATISKIEFATQLYLPIIVVAELLYGFQLGTKLKFNLDILTRFIQKQEVKVLNTSFETAQIFAQVKQGLKEIGKPIPTNDVWIAALAIETGSTLFTLDHHFNHIRGLRLLR